MTIVNYTPIDIGAAPNDKTGTPARTAASTILNPYLQNISNAIDIDDTTNNATFASSIVNITDGNYDNTFSANSGGDTIHADNAVYTGSIKESTTDTVQGSSWNFFKGISDVDGTPDTQFILRGDGIGFADVSWSTPAADYAEYFEWADGNPDSDDRVGLSVVLVDGEIRLAVDGEIPFGIISGAPSFIGNNPMNNWAEKFLKDDFNRYIREPFSIVEWTEIIQEFVAAVLDKKGKIATPEIAEKTKYVAYHTDRLPKAVLVPNDAVKKSENEDGVVLMRKMLNPAYDPNLPYVARENRKEWAVVGLTGILRMVKGSPVASNWIKMKDISDNVDEWLVK